jgi:hypothetical protein
MRPGRATGTGTHRRLASSAVYRPVRYMASVGNAAGLGFVLMASLWPNLPRYGPVAFRGRTQPIDATPFASNPTRWNGMHMEGHEGQRPSHLAIQAVWGPSFLPATR